MLMKKFFVFTAVILVIAIPVCSSGAEAVNPLRVIPHPEETDTKTEGASSAPETIKSFKLKIFRYRHRLFHASDNRPADNPQELPDLSAGT